MHLDLYVEEPSARRALEGLLPRLLGNDDTFNVNTFRSKGDLLKKVPDRLRGYSTWLPQDWRIVILVDQDSDDCKKLKRRILRAAKNANLDDRVLVRIVVEELEAWWFGDVPALQAVYPRVPSGLSAKARYRDPDAIAGGTWEALDRELRRAGYGQGLNKGHLAEAIVPHLDVNINTSRSFQVFRDGIRRLCSS